LAIAENKGDIPYECFAAFRALCRVQTTLQSFCYEIVREIVANAARTWWQGNVVKPVQSLIDDCLLACSFVQVRGAGLLFGALLEPLLIPV
jgi:hypothetical protein